MGATTEVRDHLVRALEADLVGPFAGWEEAETAEELLPLPPARWYLTGFLAPQDARDTEDPTSEEEIGALSDEDEEEGASAEPEAKQRNFFPASIGMSVLLPAGSAKDRIRARVCFAEYVHDVLEGQDGERRRTVWRRLPQPVRTLELPLDPEAIERGVNLPGTTGVWVGGKLEPADGAPGLPSGTRALSLFVVNRRPRGEKGRENEQFLFQVRLELEFDAGFVPRPNARDEDATDWDDRVADLQFRKRCEWAVGHGVAVEVPEGQGDTVRRVRTTWIPRSEVRRVKTHGDPRITTRMESLAELADAAAVRAALGDLPVAYGEWIAAQRRIDPGSPRRRATRDELLRNAERARDRIAEGIALLETDAQVREAFCLANRAMAMSARQRSPERYADGEAPSWRLFQLAFVLMNLRALADPSHPDRTLVDLIFFPTGGGKTEAYLGVVAFALVLRRLRGAGRPDGGLGVAVMLRYTLRLLTLDQLGRAATLVCALERLRQEAQGRLGTARFAVGLWVGRSATANTLKQVAERITEYRNGTTSLSPFPLTECPWCRQPLKPDSLVLEPNRTRPRRVVVACVSPSCDFNARRNRDGLPVVFVDEQLYRELPAFLVATVDKFAMLPWRGETGMLFGRVQAFHDGEFFGPLDSPPSGAIPLPDGLQPPELIVQDELHLISGPLGTMVGLYETAIEWLASGAGITAARPPKIVASTATVRRAREQIRALFGRPDIALFPPPGVDENESWFATVDQETPGRLYVGVAAQGRALRGILLRTYATLMAAAQKCFDPQAGAMQPADPYMTLVGYFNSLRELGGMRRLVEDEVRTRCEKAEERRPRDLEGTHPWFANRRVAHEPLELTSRENTAKIADSRARLAQPHVAPTHVDVLLASNMISVGVDIDRLGLMVIGGQPKTTSEYIQASSRVGRQHPGLVVTCYNLRKPRDRSHYERFVAYHETFYRFVEVASLTPFSGPALDRGFAGALVGMTRLADPVLTPPLGAMEIVAHRQAGEAAVEALARRAADLASSGGTGDTATAVREKLTARGRNLLDTWETLVVRAAQEAAAQRCYSRFDVDRQGKPLLFMAIDDDRPEHGTDDAKFCAPTSMRDVEPNVHLWITRKALGGRK